MPDQHPTGGQGHTPVNSQPMDGISDAARWYMGLRAEAQAGAPPVAAQGADPAGQGGAGAGGTANGSGGGFNWELFPDVPEEHRALLEPHLKAVQGHVTKLEQQFAPFKPVAESGLNAETLQGLVALNQQFDQDPVGTWLTIAANLQKEGTLSSDLDLEAVKAILEGRDPDGGETPEAAGGGEGEDEIPAWAREIQEWIRAQDQQAQTRQQQEAQQQRAGELKVAMDNMRTQLTEAGYSEDAIDDDLLRGAIIASQGDTDKALQMLTGLRESVLKGFTESNGNGSGSSLEMPKGPPKTPERNGRGPGREFAKARRGATQFLESRLRAEAQE